MYPRGKNGRELIQQLVEQVSAHPRVTVLTESEVVAKGGSFGNLEATVRTAGDDSSDRTVKVGSVVVATGFDSYHVSEDEFGYGNKGVVTLPEFVEIVDSSNGALEYDGRPVRSVAYIYCVGSRQPEGNQYCSRYCCTAAIHASLSAGRLLGGEAIHQYHLYRDIRSYGKYELLYNESREQGDLYLRFPDDEPPMVAAGTPSDDYRLSVTTRDVLTGGEELTIPVDLVVLVTGMVPRENEGLVQTLKLPVGRDGFFNEIHPKLRPVETVVDGVYICGACQSPKNSAEAVASGLAAVAQSASILKRGFAELDPLIAVVDHDACTWCGKCLEVCPYDAPVQVDENGKSVAVIDKAACKGCGACVPVCPQDAIDLQGYTDAQIKAMIDGLMEEIVPCNP